MTRYEILIELNGVKQQLDTYKLDPISLTFNVADVADISSRNSSFSKTIKLPETGNNRLIFGDISDLGVDSSFNPNKKTKCWILVDTAVVFEGFLQLKKVFVDKELDKADYEIVIYADNDNFFKQLGNKFITDSDYSELNHNWSAANIRNSWTSDWSSGYYYPLIDYGYDWDLGEVNGWTNTYNTQVRTKDMFPATNAKYIWDKIFNDAGYTYQSNFLNSQVFTSLYIPFNREKLLRPNTATASRFSIGRTQSATFSTNVTRTIAPSRIIENDPYYGPIDVPNEVVTLLGTFSVPFNSETSPNGDPDNLYNTTTYQYTAPVNFISQRFVCNFDITFRFNVNFSAFAFGFSGAYGTSICFKRSRNPNTGATVSGGYVMPVNGSIAARPFTAAGIPGIQYEAAGGTAQAPRRCYGQISTDILDNSTVNQKKLFPGERVWVEVRYSALNTDIRTTIGNSNLLPPTTIVAGVSYNTTLPTGTACGTFSGNNKFFNILNNDVLVDELIDYNQILPLNIKQSDFIVSIIKMFNLYVEPSKEYENQLIIEPRDAYYAAGKVKDWTQKLNIDEDIEEQILGDTQNKKTIWKYKDDKDFYNEDYKNNRGGLSYGEFNFYSSNEFVSGEKKVEITFSPTPLVPIMNPNAGQTSLIIPKIGKLNNNLWAKTESNIRILTRFNSSTNSNWVYGDYQFFSDASQWNAYTVLTSNGFGNAIHSFKVGDYVNVNQTDGGSLKPMLQGNFKVVAIRDNKSIVINIPFSSVGSGAAVGGTVTPLNGMLPVANDNDTWQFEGVRYKAYPYLGHFNNPQEPAYDINFGQTNGLYYLEETVTSDNLYSVYWENFVNELFDKDSRIITASFYLSPFDIADFRFNDNIYIRDQYYKVNKILNYDPTKEALVKVELIKTKFITIPRAFSNTKPTLPITGAVGSSVPDIKKPPRPTGNVISAGTNVAVGVKSIVVGKDNAVYASKSLVLGASNSVASDTKAYVLGDNNGVDGNTEKTLVIGDNNIIAEGVTGSVVFGSDNRVEASNVTLIGVNGAVATQSGMTYLGPSFSIAQDGSVFYNGATFSGSQDLETTLGYGNITGPHDIVMTTGQKITSDTGSQSIDMNVSGFGTTIHLESTSASDVTDIISIDPDQNGYNTGIVSTNNTAGEYSIITFVPSQITNTVNDGVNLSNLVVTANDVTISSIDSLSNITDTISVDPQGLLNGTGIFSDDAALTKTAHIKVQSQSPSLMSSDGVNVGNINVGMGYIVMDSNDGATGITDTISIDPQNLGNGTGIKSEDPSTGSQSQITVTTTQIGIDSQSVKLTQLSGTAGVLGIDSNGVIGLTSSSGQTLAQTLALGNTSGTYSILFTDGSSGTPSISFASDTDTGMYRTANNVVGIAAGGAEIMRIGGNTTLSTGTFRVPNGSLSAPTVTFTNFSNTGLFIATASQLGIAAGGATAAVFNSAGITLPSGSAASPSIRFASAASAQTGIHNNFGNEMMIYSGPNRTLWLSGTKVIFSELANSPIAPPITFGTDYDTGVYRPADNQVAIATGGITSSLFNSSGIVLPQLSNTALAVDSSGQIIATSSAAPINGSTNWITKFTTNTTLGTASIIENGSQVLMGYGGNATAPGISFFGDLDTGIAKPFANEITIVAGGLTAASFTTQGLEINGEITSTYSVANPPLYFNGATDTGILYSYQHPFTNRLIVAAGGATSAIFTPFDVRIQSLISTPGSPTRLVTVGSNGALTSASSFGTYSYRYTTTTTAITSTTGLMVGLAYSFTPATSGAVSVNMNFGSSASGTSTTHTFNLRYGTGTAPTNGAALAGTVTGTMSNRQPGSTMTIPVGINTIVTGLTVGTAYWFDLSVAATSGNSQVTTVNANFREM